MTRGGLRPVTATMTRVNLPMKDLRRTILDNLKDSQLIELVLQYETQGREYQAELIHRYRYAVDEVSKLTQDRLLGSAIIIQATHLGGREALAPISISDGLGDATIAALKSDLLRTYDRKIEMPPKRD